MVALVIISFVVGYSAIVLEHPLKLDKTVPALIMASIMWAILAVGFHYGILDIVSEDGTLYSHVAEFDESAEAGFAANLLYHLGKTAEILIFLIGAMTIVEIIDLHKGFDVLKSLIKTDSKKKLLWLTGTLAFLLSAIIDNLTATIVLITFLRKIIKSSKERIWFAALIVIAANAGGAWSPIGDVTTTMLWIGKKVSTIGLIEWTIIPSIICFVVPFWVASYMKPFRGKLTLDSASSDEENLLLSSKKMLYLGLGAIIFVPIFKTLTHLPPYLGMMLSMAVVWMVAEYIKPEEEFVDERKLLYSPHKALAKIELSSILFFLGILMGVAALESMAIGSVGALHYLAEGLEHAIPNQDLVVMFLGICSSVVDNVPLVAAAMGMYDLPMDDHLWQFIAYCAGTGGSILIIGSAAGVAAMGMEKIDFIWYFRKITLLALLGFLVGAGVFLLHNAAERALIH